MKSETFTTDFENTELKTVKALIIHMTERNIKGGEWTTSKKAKEKKPSQRDRNILETTRTDSKMDRGGFCLTMGAGIKGNLKMGILMGTGLISGAMDEIMKATGPTTK